MSPFEVAVLRILVKRQQPVKFSVLVGGFPDDCEDSVLSAISALELGGYIVISDYGPDGYVVINRAKRHEILQIVESDIGIPFARKIEGEAQEEKKIVVAPISGSKSKPSFVMSRAGLSGRTVGIAIASILVVGLLGTGFASQTASSGQESVIHHAAFHNHWNAYSNAPGSNLLLVNNYHTSASFVAWHCKYNATSQSS